MLPKRLLEIIACPECRSPLELAGGDAGEKLTCTGCGLTYDIIEGVPILLPKSLPPDLQLTQQKWELEYATSEEDFALDTDADPYLRDSHRHIVKYLKPAADGLYLEVGCGPAKDACLLAKLGVPVIGVDISISALRNARELFRRENVEGLFVCGDILNLPFRDDVFACMYAGGSIEHFKDTGAAVKGLYRCLAPGGRLTATVPCVSLSTLTYSQLWGNIPELPVIKTLWETFHYTLLKGRFMKFGYEKSFTLGKLRGMFARAGFADIAAGLFETYYEISFFKNHFLKALLRNLAKRRLFWPFVYVNGRKPAR